MFVLDEGKDKRSTGIMFWHGLTRFRPDNLATDDLYHFQPLSASTTIRLIKVLPRKVMGQIACRIFHFNERQQDAIRYHALSYVWGDAKQTREIYLQDQDDQGNKWHPFPLHENLWQFLDHAWRSRLFDQLFWTDYLCLDQNGHEEISEQVPRMHAIYRNAELVVIWLQLKRDQQKGLRKVVRLSGRPKLMSTVLHSSIQEDEQKGLRKSMRWGVRLYDPKVLLSLCQDAIQGAMDDPYWGRIWIVQEVVVAKKVRVMTSDISIDLDELRVLADKFVDARSWAEKPSIWLLCDMRAVGGKIPLWRILRDFKRYQSSRPVDRVFGMLGMVEDHEDGSSPAQNIQVDYDKSMWQVLLDAIFESSPPLTEYKMTIHCLDPDQVYNGFSLLRRYRQHGSTTKRHRTLARIAMEAFEAFNLIKWAIIVPPLDDASDLMSDLFSSAAEIDWEPALAQSAALIGLMLSTWNRDPLPEWIFYRDEYEADQLSPWRCAAHGSHDGGPTGLGSYETVASVLTKHSCFRVSIVIACGQQSQSCNGSMMACEISDIGLRLQVESGMNPGDASRLRLCCLKLET